MIEHKKEILSIFENGICIGFIARRSVIRGYALDIENGWIVVEDFSNLSEWRGNYLTRKQAISALKGK